MLFNTIDFAIFLPIVFCIYWFLAKNLKVQNLFITVASYVFYGCWDWRFLILIFISSTVDFKIAYEIENTTNRNRRKYLLFTSVLLNLGLLAYFKYFNFFISSFTEVFTFFGHSVNSHSLNIILPVGISFYTFQTLSYTIDVYRKQLKATNRFIPFLAFVSFFPQLVAGPIERATSLLPQFLKSRKFDKDKAIQGINLIVWGFFKKLVIADNCANYVDQIFERYDQMNSFSLLLGGVYFSFQIYCDFSGYSDIAIGLGRLFGFNLMRNFNYPYFSRNIGEFWRRWHISLSTWFRDYLYIPLGGSRISKFVSLRNIFIIFLVSGIWHGANWTFVIWGLLHAFCFVPSFLLNKNRKYLDNISTKFYLPGLTDFLAIFKTNIIVIFGWIIFRSKTLHEAALYLKRMFNPENIEFQLQYLSIERYAPELLILIFLFVILEWFNRKNEHPIHGRFKTLKLSFIIVGIVLFGVFSDSSEFIYFQF
ncbi:MBOAT family protein [Zunongwangia sp. SCSIO 43204]|uniref:MBOAT family O-acyltransferase n=1 Tax=Zunongwangia sp. SCSIO 43204 TaxID=2779359 RepID=UPI001CA991C8|nr:MBOAT family O-acyltransferase [Zunongwangia sp. SCSIO 43204]UAB83194.1 MBOAT family protein [Zunongwangia sp. SCSIO 43204]